MERKRVYQLFAILMLVALVPMLLAYTGREPAPVLSAAPAQDVWDPTGPYADRVIFHVIVGQDVQVAALIQGQIDHLADNVEASYIEDLEANPDIEVTRSGRLGFGHLSINCQRYPYTYPQLRRAISLAADKHEVATIMWGGLGFALDTPIPELAGVWHNPDTPNYKEPQVAAAIAELEAGGFLDVDGDGYVEAPDGSDFTFRPMYAIEAPQWGAAMTSQAVYWDQCGLSVEPQPLAFNTLLDIVYTLPRNYDGANYAYGVSPNPLILQNFVTDQIANPEGNHLNWANDTFDYWVDVMMTSPDYDTVLDAAHQAQQVFAEQVPMCIWYSNWEVNAHRTDRWEGHIVIPGWGTAGMNRWTPRIVHLKEGQAGRDPTLGTGGTFNTLIASAMDSQNPLTSTSVYGNYPLSQIYTSLTGLNDPRDHSPTFGGGGLSNYWELHEEATGLRFDFTLMGADDPDNSAYWHDMGGNAGGRVTTEDVKFTYDYIVNKSIPGYITAIPYYNRTVITDDYHCSIYTNGKSYWAFDQLRQWTILPKHIWQGIVSPTTFSNPQPIGCGPFTWYQRIEGEYVEMKFWENYHAGIEGHTEREQAPPDYLPIYLAVGVLVIVVVLLGSVWYLRKK